MVKTDKNKRGIIALTDFARTINGEIGSYQEHFINENFHYIVRLDNGRIDIPVENAQDYEVQPGSISDEQIIRIANSYQNH